MELASSVLAAMAQMFSSKEHDNMIKIEYRKAFFRHMWFGRWWCSRCQQHYYYENDCNLCEDGYWQHVNKMPWPVLAQLPKEKHTWAMTHDNFHDWLTTKEWTPQDWIKKYRDDHGKS